MSSPSIAVLDDEPDFRQALARLLKSRGFTVQVFTSGRELLEVVSPQPFACVLLDLHMPDLNGFDILARLNARGARVPAIVITGHDAPGNYARAHSLGAADYLLKPLDEAALLAAVARVTTPPK